MSGPVSGFLLRADGEPIVYFSGDNASVQVAEQIAEREGPVDVAILNIGAVQLPQRFAGAYLTLSSDRACLAALALGARKVIPLHFEGWTHFTEGLDRVRAAFAGYGMSDRLLVAERGQTVSA